MPIQSLALRAARLDSGEMMLDKMVYITNNMPVDAMELVIIIHMEKI